MTYGLRVINDDSELLIDSEYFSPTFVQKLEFDPTPFYDDYTGSNGGYVRRRYITPVITTAGEYIVMWTLPNNGDINVYYTFESSTISMNQSLTCSVYADTTGSPLSYTLPTAYLFTLAPDSLPASSGPALRMYNSLGQKTFDSNNAQLAPYNISDSFSFPIFNSSTNYGAIPTSITITSPGSPLYLLPFYGALRITKYPPGVPRHIEEAYHPGYRRVHNTIYSRYFIYQFADEDSGWPSTQTLYQSGRNNDLSIIVADADVYAAPSGEGGGGSNPTYQLTSSSNPIAEGQTLVITLDTTLVLDGTLVPYTVSGVAGADLSVGGLSGNFEINNNTATASFTFSNDSLTEGAETFQLSLTGLSQTISVVVQDTSIGNAVYSFSTPTNSVNEGSSGSNTFSATNAGGKVVTFNIIAPTSGNSVDGFDGSLLTGTYTVPSNSLSTVAVQYSVTADNLTEGPEYFRLTAIVDGQPVATSQDILVNDTSQSLATYSISAADNWNESSTNTVTITATNANGKTLYLTTSNGVVVPGSSSIVVNSNSFSTNVSYTAGIVSSNTAVSLYVRPDSVGASPAATKNITVVDVGSSYSFSAVATINEGTTDSNLFTATYAANKAITFSVVSPSSGLDGSGDVTLYTTSFNPTSNSASSSSVSYSVAADATTEGTEYFRIKAYVGGSEVAATGNIPIGDTSRTPGFSITANSAPWAESGTRYASVTVTDYAGQYVYLNTSNGSVTCDNTPLYIPNNSYTTTVSYTVGDLPSTTNVTLYLRTGSEFGTVQASTVVSVVHTPPAPAYNLYNTFSSLANGSSGTFFLRSTNASGVTVTVSDNSARASVNPTSFTISSNGTTDTYITVTATVPTTSVGAETVTINLSTGNSFQFTIPAYTLSAPLVSSVTYLNGQTFYYAGEIVTALINFNGPITSDTYARVELNAGVYGTGNNVIVGGQNNSIGYFPLGATTGYYTSPANPGIYNTTGKVGARCETSGGTIRQAYVYGSNFTLSTLPPP